MYAAASIRRSSIKIALLLAGATILPAGASAQCGDVIPAASAPTSSPRTIVADDLLRLRDIGPADSSLTSHPSPFGLSPGGKQAAFVVTRAEPESNTYCKALLVLSLDGRSAPRILDRGGEFISDRIPAYGRLVENGSANVVTPSWSPDGGSIAYLRRDNGITQAWVAKVDGSGARSLTRSAVDVEALAWNPNGSRLVFSSRPAIIDATNRRSAEAREGWLYDESFAPVAGAQPQLPIAPIETFSADVESGKVDPATEDEKALLTNGIDNGLRARSPDGRQALAIRQEDRPFAPLKLSVSSPGGVPRTCDSPACDGDFIGLWWRADASELLYLRREGWAKGSTALYSWSAKAGAPPKKILETGDVLLGCALVAEELLCTRENATSPRRLTLVNSRTGKMRDIYDPNPEFRSIQLGTARRLRWKNDLGLEAWGDLVLPPDFRPGQKLPMIVVQYHSDGFLRGGTGDEYPIHAFAARGFAVLSVEKPAMVTSLDPAIDTSQWLRSMTKGWAERRSLLSSLETGVKAAIATGAIDPERIGITGLSDGASTARFALINTDLFAAASISSCCVDERTLTYGGYSLAGQFEAIGYPPPGDDDAQFWQPYSLAYNASRLDRPLLMQLADDEYLIGVHSITQLRQSGQPAEMFVFPNEHHIKWQPTHRKAIYERNLDWFSFWLKGEIDSEPAKKAQFQRWAKLRTKAAD